MNVQCAQCQIPFEKEAAQIKKTKRNFCSRSCSGKFNSTGIARNPPIERVCKLCSSTFKASKLEGHRSTKYCKQCFVPRPSEGVFRSMTLREYRDIYAKKYQHPSWTNAALRQCNRLWNIELTVLPCRYCGYSKHVELAHVKAIKDFSESTTLEEINAKTNVVQLCRNHHWELDHDLLSIQEIMASP